jgi:hypothetical protein
VNPTKFESVLKSCTSWFPNPSIIITKDNDIVLDQIVANYFKNFEPTNFFILSECSTSWNQTFGKKVWLACVWWDAKKMCQLYKKTT